jgi:hydroxypyruvate isomerase
MTAASSHRYDVNCSILFTELPLLARPAAVQAAGFAAAEYWWPFAVASPADREVNAFIASVRDAGIQLVSLNFFAGDLAAGDRGLASLPDRAAEFRDSVQVAAAIGVQLGCHMFNALYGNRDDGVGPDRQYEAALGNLVYAADVTAAIGGTVLIEAISGADLYPLRSAAAAVAVVDEINRESGSANCRFLADLYHLTVNGDDLEAVIAQHSPSIGHVQIADAPGRGAPGTGQIDFDARLNQLSQVGYQGWVGLEYKPAGSSADTFGWLPPENRSVPQARPSRAGGSGR